MGVQQPRARTRPLRPLDWPPSTSRRSRDTCHSDSVTRTEPSGHLHRQPHHRPKPHTLAGHSSGSENPMILRINDYFRLPLLGPHLRYDSGVWTHSVERSALSVLRQEPFRHEGQPTRPNRPHWLTPIPTPQGVVLRGDSEATPGRRGGDERPSGGEEEGMVWVGE
jgi:hypothetical protein